MYGAVSIFLATEWLLSPAREWLVIIRLKRVYPLGELSWEAWR